MTARTICALDLRRMLPSRRDANTRRCRLFRQGAPATQAASRSKEALRTGKTGNDRNRTHHQAVGQCVSVQRETAMG